MSEKLVTETEQNAAVEGLKRLVSKPSANDPQTVSKTTPFGQGIDDALTEVLKIAEENGFKTFKILKATMVMLKLDPAIKSLESSATLTSFLPAIRMIGILIRSTLPSRMVIFTAVEPKTTKGRQWPRCSLSKL